MLNKISTEQVSEVRVLNATVRNIFVSPGHNFRGHHGREPDDYLADEVPSVQCIAGRGLVGDRYYSYEQDYKGQITFFDWAVFLDLCNTLDTHDRPASVLRRNIIIDGVDLNDLVGKRFEIQGIQFQGSEECKPCYWMDRAFAPGAYAAMEGRGGLRARILTSGELRSSAPPLR